MPEGDTIFRAARTLHRALAGSPVVRFESAYAHVAAAAVDRPIVGRVVERVHAVGKHLLVTFSDHLVLRTHMRMNGSWHIYRVDERWQRPARDMRVLIATAEFVAVGFNIPIASLHTAAALARNEDLRRLGPDLLGAAFDEEEALRRLFARPDRAVADAILDQSVMAGAGNVYKSEALFLCRLSPFAPVATVGEDRLRALVTTTRKLMRANVVDGKGDGIVTYHGFRRTTHRGDAAERLWVYGRVGRPCRRCGTAIELRRQGPHARSTYFCPRCQIDAR